MTPDTLTGSQAKRGLQVYLLLTHVAVERRTMPYAELARRLKVKHGKTGVLGPLLTPAWKWCKSRSLPPLGVLVVDAHGECPGFDKDKKWLPVAQRKKSNQQLREDVFGQDWYAIAPPTIKQLEDLLKNQ